MSNSCNPTYLEHNKALILSTHGIIFCGVPHQGGNGVSEGKILLNASSVVTSTTTNIVRILEPGNEVLRTQRDSFTPISGQFYTVPLFETERTPLILGSSILVGLSSNHSYAFVMGAKPSFRLFLVTLLFFLDSLGLSIAHLLDLTARTILQWSSFRQRQIQRIEPSLINSYLCYASLSEK